MLIFNGYSVTHLLWLIKCCDGLPSFVVELVSSTAIDVTLLHPT